MRYLDNVQKMLKIKVNSAEALFDNWLSKEPVYAHCDDRLKERREQGNVPFDKLLLSERHFHRGSYGNKA